jgi:hypothetical protein
MPRGVSYTKLETIKQKIEELPAENQKAILKIIKEDDVMFSENVNGVFFDIVNIETDTLRKIQSYLDFCDKSEEYLEERVKNEKAFLKEYELTHTNKEREPIGITFQIQGGQVQVNPRNYGEIPSSGAGVDGGVDVPV